MKSAKIFFVMNLQVVLCVLAFIFCYSDPCNALPICQPNAPKQTKVVLSNAAYEWQNEWGGNPYNMWACDGINWVPTIYPGQTVYLFLSASYVLHYGGSVSTITKTFTYCDGTTSTISKPLEWTDTPYSWQWVEGLADPCFVYQSKNCDCFCNLSGVTISQSEVWPARTEEGIFTQATVGISLANPAPSAGCEVRLRVDPVEGAGGHNHDGNRSAHTGAVDPNIVDFVPGESILNVVYNSGEVSGTERIIAESVDSNGAVTSTQSVSVDVRVPDLVSLGGFISYQLTGSRDAHPDNHYGLISTVNAIGSVADQYYIETGVLLGINDMSLVWGGLFDISGSWNPPHSSHRKGTSVDIDRHAYINGAYVVVDRQQLDRIAGGFNGELVVEPTIHYEFE